MKAEEDDKERGTDLIREGQKRWAVAGPLDQAGLSRVSLAYWACSQLWTAFRRKHTLSLSQTHTHNRDHWDVQACGLMPLTPAGFTPVADACSFYTSLFGE